MRYTIVGRNIEVTPGLREAVEDKIGKLDRYFTPDTEVNVTMSVQRERQNIEVTIPIKGSIIRAEESSSDMYVSIDLVEEVIERQILKYKKKLVDRKQSSPSFSDTFLQEDTPISEDEIKRRYLIRHLLIYPGLNEEEYHRRFQSRADVDFPFLGEWIDKGWLVRDSFLALSAMGLGLSDYLGPQMISRQIRQRMDAWEACHGQ